MFYKFIYGLVANLNIYKIWFVWLMSLFALTYTASDLKKNIDWKQKSNYQIKT